jgi:hypothetical protein
MDWPKLRVRLGIVRRIVSVLVLSSALPLVLAAQIKITVQLSPTTNQAFDKYAATAEMQMNWQARTAAKPGATWI